MYLRVSPWDDTGSGRRPRPRKRALGTLARRRVAPIEGQPKREKLERARVALRELDIRSHANSTPHNINITTQTSQTSHP